MPHRNVQLTSRHFTAAPALNESLTGAVNASLYGWGNNFFGQLAANISFTVISILCNRMMSKVLFRPTRVGPLANLTLNLVGVYAGNYHSAVVSSTLSRRVCELNALRFRGRCDGSSVFMWGSNEDGQLSVNWNITERSDTIGLTDNLVGRNVSVLALGFRHSLAVLGLSLSRPADLTLKVDAHLQASTCAAFALATTRRVRTAREFRVAL